jgi:hypothetical protein
MALRASRRRRVRTDCAWGVGCVPDHQLFKSVELFDEIRTLATPGRRRPGVVLDAAGCADGILWMVRTGL